MEYILPIGIFIVFGIVFGVLLTVISKVFAVKVDERAQKITETLPGANCGACPVGGAPVAAKVGEIMGVAVTAAERKIPVVHCNGTCEATKPKFAFDGVQTCASAKRFYGGTGSCMHGCLGLGDCAAACEKDCIRIQDGLAVICTEECISCGKCAKACPNGLITLRSEKKKVDVLCSSKDMGKTAMQACQHACIGCKKCEKICKFDAIHVIDNHAVIDYDKCRSCGLCVKECPKQCIVKQVGKRPAVVKPKTDAEPAKPAAQN